MNQPQQPLVTGPGGGLPSGPGPIAPAQRSDTRGEKCGDMCTSVDLFSGSDIISAIWSEDACECLVVPKGTTPVINFTMDEGKKKLQSTGQSSSQMVLCDTVTVGNEKNGSNWDKFYPLGNLCDPFPAGSGEYEGTPVSTYVSLLLAHSMNTASEYAKTTAGFTVPAGSKGKKGKIKKQKKQTLTLLCPGSFDQRQLAILNKAADQAGIPVRNFFNRGVASVTGVLDRSRKEIKNKTVSASTGSGSTNLYSVLSAYTASTAKEEKNDPIVLYLNVYAICNCSEATGSDSKRVYYYDAMLVQGEGGINALQVGSRLGFERLNTIAILGGNIPISSSSSSSTSSTSSASTGCLDEKAIDTFLNDGVASKVVDELVAMAQRNNKHHSINTTSGNHRSDSNRKTAAAGEAAPVMADDEVTKASSINAIVLDGMLAAAQWSTDKTLKSLFAPSLQQTPPSIPVVKASPKDAVTGACLLSAAELDSSKHYLQLEDGWSIAYLLPIADGVLQGGDIGMHMLWDEAQAATADNDYSLVETLARVGDRLWKEDIGPIPRTASATATAAAGRGAGAAAAAAKNDDNHQQNQNQSKISMIKEFKYRSNHCVTKSCNITSSSVPSSTPRNFKNDTHPEKVAPKSPGYPRVEILQRRKRYGADGTSSSSEGQYYWHVIKKFKPLLSTTTTTTTAAAGAEGVGDAGEALQSSTVNITIEPETGRVSMVLLKGPSVTESWSSYWRMVALVFILLLPFLLIGLYYAYSYGTDWYSTQQHISWLTDFYVKNAPEKLKDPAYVARTVKKYKGKMFLLWRALERTYEVKWPAPHSVLDAGGGEL